MNFIKWMQNNSDNYMLNEIIKEYEKGNKKNIDEENENEIELDNITEETVYGIIDEKQGKNHKYEIILSENKGKKYISITSQRRRENIVSWKRTKEVKMTINKLEKILRIVKEIWDNKSKTNDVQTDPK